MTATFFSDVRIPEGDSVSDLVAVTVRDGVITEVGKESEAPASAELVRGEGRTLRPGLIDAHVHVAERADLDALAAHGVTTGFDMASWPAETTAALRTETGTARIISAGVPFIGPAGTHASFGMPSYAIVTDPNEAADGVARRTSDGSDFIKIVTEPAGGGGPSPEVVEAVIAAAHEAGLRVVTHASHIDSFRMCVELGADVITHVPMGTPVDGGLAARTPAAIPTLTVAETLTTAMPRPGTSYEAARESVVALRRAGITIAAGTDAVNAPNVPFSIAIGSTLHHELELLVGAGLSPAEALQAATAVPAEMFGLEDRGSITTGKRADLLLVDGDPTADITATRNIEGVWIGGEKYGTGCPA